MKTSNKPQISINKSNRRDFLKIATLSAGALGLMGTQGFSVNISESRAKEEKNNSGLKLTVAGYNVNRVKSLVDGRVKIKGCTINFVQAGIGDMNTNTFSGDQTYDVTEIGLHPFMLAYANDHFRDYTLLPIFPLRIFRHKSVFIRNDRGIKKPEDLKGKTIGTPGYSSTSLTWLRGIFQDEYGIKPEDVKWVISNKDSSADAAGKISKQEQVNPKGVNIIKGTAGLDESELLITGEVDALFHAAEPKAYIDGNPLVDRLFPDSRKTERAYFSKTGIFPIMHAVAIKKELLNKNPWLAKAVFNAYSEAKTMDYIHMKKLGWVYDSLPWYGQELEETRALMGENFWPYGIGPNRKALDTLFRYSFEQGLSSRKLTIEELFHPSSLELIESDA
ncbi:MAG: ABC transporter substrate-binding protein [Calditrichia bacterium]|nr:ABC transporter substrate-binding protein [Calditrichia bacterium]